MPISAAVPFPAARQWCGCGCNLLQKKPRRKPTRGDTAAAHRGAASSAEGTLPASPTAAELVTAAVRGIFLPRQSKLPRGFQLFSAGALIAVALVAPRPHFLPAVPAVRRDAAEIGAMQLLTSANSQLIARTKNV